MEGGSVTTPTFYMRVNNIDWRVIFTGNPDDLELNHTIRLGITDRKTQTVYLYDGLRGNLLKKVLLHELTHVWLFSYGYDLGVEVEEMICEFVDTYAENILEMAQTLINTGFEENENLLLTNNEV